MDRNLCAKLAQNCGCAYLDMSAHITMSKEDGLHFDQATQAVFAVLVAQKILEEEADPVTANLRALLNNFHLK